MAKGNLGLRLEKLRPKPHRVSTQVLCRDKWDLTFLSSLTDDPLSIYDVSERDLEIMSFEM